MAEALWSILNRKSSCGYATHFFFHFFSKLTKSWNINSINSEIIWKKMKKKKILAEKWWEKKLTVNLFICSVKREKFYFIEILMEKIWKFKGFGRVKRNIK
jgi:hypothetical protein